MLFANQTTLFPNACAFHAQSLHTCCSPNGWVPPSTLKSGGARFSTGRYPRKPQAGKKPVSLATRRRLERLGRNYQPPVDTDEMKRRKAEKKKMRQLQKQRKLRQLQKAEALKQAVAQAAATDQLFTTPFRHEDYLPSAKGGSVGDSTDKDADWDHIRHQVAKRQAELAQLEEIQVDDQQSSAEQTSAQDERVDSISRNITTNGDRDRDTQHSSGSTRAKHPHRNVDDAQDDQKFEDCVAPAAENTGVNVDGPDIDPTEHDQSKAEAKEVGLNIDQNPILDCENAHTLADIAADATVDTAASTVADTPGDTTCDINRDDTDVDPKCQSGADQPTVNQDEASCSINHSKDGNINPGLRFSHETGENSTTAGSMVAIAGGSLHFVADAEAELEEKHATKLQAAGRGFLMRKRARKLMEQRAEELRRIQREYIAQAVNYVRSHLAEVLHEDVVREQVDAWGQLVWGRLRDMVVTVTVSRVSTKTKLRVQGEVPAQFAVAFGDLMDLNVIQDSYLKLSSIGDKSPLIGSTVSPGDVVLSVRGCGLCLPVFLPLALRVTRCTTFKFVAYRCMWLYIFDSIVGWCRSTESISTMSQVSSNSQKRHPTCRSRSFPQRASSSCSKTRRVQSCRRLGMRHDRVLLTN